MTNTVDDIKNTELPITKIADDIFVASMPMAPPLNQVNVYFLKDGDGWVMIDSALNTPEHKQIFQDIFDTQLDGLPVKKLIVTHFHPDHIGLAGWVCKKWGCHLYMTRPEYLMARALSLDTTEAYIDGIDHYYTCAGLPKDVKQQIVSKGNTLAARIYPIPARYQVLRDRKTIQIGGYDWLVLPGSGHAPAQACLYCEERNIVISADHVVARITPNISVWPLETNGNPLEDYLDSLKEWRHLMPEQVTVLPGHGRTFDDLHDRIDRLEKHHDKRLDQLKAILEAESNLTLYQIMERLFKPNMDFRNVVFALAETHAHVNYDVYKGTISVDKTGEFPLYALVA